ncbi:hypothetical protein [Paenibacillus durus]|uniref:Lipoprotein n=1 Tax=Paenibacillus durus TaxID=44251 RepID=A0A089J029_PAEDU|nr:hypothetical protein [Paenibacillus durus]AIQ14544.1 hypothetical protein PDUR_23625 [Paenibacillus durus]
MKMLTVIVTLIFIVGCDFNIKMSDKIIDSKCSTNNTCVISIDDFTDFEWDKMVFFQVGSSNTEISNALGIEYTGQTDLMSGMIFVLKNKVVHEERVPYDPEHPNKLQYTIEKKPKDPNYVIFTSKKAELEGKREKIDGVLYYTFIAKKE